MSVFQGYAAGTEKGIDEAMVRRALLVLADPANGIELRCLPSARFFVLKGNDLDGLTSAAVVLSDESGVYYTLNPIPVKLTHRTRVDDVLRRRWFLVDIDSVRAEKDESATDAEKAGALLVTNKIKSHLLEIGWPDPVEVDSGNGYHLLYRVDLPSDEASQHLLGGVLRELARIFDSPFAMVDKSVHNASRIAKLPGTWARKGRSSQDRPHRMAKLIHVPQPVEIVSASLLGKASLTVQTPKALPLQQRLSLVAQALEGIADNSDLEAKSYGRAALKNEIDDLKRAAVGERNHRLNTAAFRMGQLVAGGHLDDEEADDKLQEVGLAIGLTASEVKATVKSGLMAGKRFPRAPEPRVEANGKPEVGGVEVKKPPMPTIYRLPDLMNLELPDPNWAIPGLLCEGLNILAGKPKLGKSWMALNLAVTIAGGGLALNEIRTVAGEVLYLSLEDRLRRVKTRAGLLLKGLGVEASERLHVAVEWPRQDAGGLDLVGEWIARAFSPRLIIIDVWAKFRPQSKGGRSMYDQDYEHANGLKSLADQHNVSVLLVHHCKKMPSEDVFDEISGTLGFAGAADGMLVLSRARNENEAVLSITGRDIDEKKMGLLFDPEKVTWTSTGDADERQTGEVITSILATLKRVGEPMYPRDIADATGKKHESVKSACWRLEGQGRLIKSGQKYKLPVETVAEF